MPIFSVNLLGNIVTRLLALVKKRFAVTRSSFAGFLFPLYTRVVIIEMYRTEMAQIDEVDFSIPNKKEQKCYTFELLT